MSLFINDDITQANGELLAVDTVDLGKHTEHKEAISDTFEMINKFQSESKQNAIEFKEQVLCQICQLSTLNLNLMRE